MRKKKKEWTINFGVKYFYKTTYYHQTLRLVYSKFIQSNISKHKFKFKIIQRRIVGKSEWVIDMVTDTFPC